MFAVAAARVHFESSGLFVVAVSSGLTDMDAITLSTSRLVSADRLTPKIGWKVIVAAVMANLVFKAGLVAMLGHRKLFFRVAGLFGVLVIVGGVLIATLKKAPVYQFQRLTGRQGSATAAPRRS